MIAVAKPRHRQAGAALLTALLVMSLAASIVAGLVWRADIEAERVIAQTQMSQARWVLAAAQTWAQVLLRHSVAANPTATSLADLWAQPLPWTRIDQLPGLQLSPDDVGQLQHMYVAGQIEDAQAHFNLSSLLRQLPNTQADIDPNAQALLHRLLQAVGLDPGLAAAIGHYVVQQARAHPQQPLHDLNALLNVPGIDPSRLDRMRPVLSLLPHATPINVNTAPAAVLQAALPMLDAAAISRFLQRRQHVYLRQPADLQLWLQSALPTSTVPDLSALDVDSQYFTLQLQVRIDHVRVRQQSLIWRAPRGHQLRVIYL